MHAIEIIVRKNAHAAGRAAGHAINDSDVELYNGIAATEYEPVINVLGTTIAIEAYRAGKLRGLNDTTNPKGGN